MGRILHVKMWIESTQNLETKNLVPRIQTAKLHRHTDNPQMGQNGSEKWIRKTDMGKVPAHAGQELFGNSDAIVYLSIACEECGVSTQI